ncbi:MAG: TPR end-of-group domain-containing protein [Microthrixaceae bacterium]
MSAPAHFRIVGVPVRVEPVFLIISALFGLRYVDIGLDVVGIWVAASFISILVHELGHGLTLKAFGQPSVIVLHSFGGVTISQRRGRLSKARGIVVSLAGSVTALLLLWLPTRQLLRSVWIVEQPDAVIWLVYFLAFQNLWWSIANLLPIRPLDGGNVTAELFGLSTARRLSIGTALFGAVWAFTHNQSYAGFFALFLAFNNWQELRAERGGHGVDAFHVDAPDPSRGRPSAPRRGRSHLSSVPLPASDEAGAPTLSPGDPARQEQVAWNALRAGDATTAQRIVARLGPTAVGPYLRAASALSAGEPTAFELFEAAYVAQPGGPPNLVATDLLARSGAAAAVARRLVDRPDGSGREGAATLQTHLHYGDHFRAAAEVGETVFAAHPPSPAQTAFEVACSWAKAGEVDQAVTWLEHAADHGFRAASIIEGEPDLAPVRADSRWPLLRARLS